MIGRMNAQRFHGADLLTSVTEGHPDKVCDQISDAVLDAVLAQDPRARVVCEVSAARGTILVFGEMTTKAYVDIPAVVRSTVARIGYANGAFGLDSEGVGISSSIGGVCRLPAGGPFATLRACRT